MQADLPELYVSTPSAPNGTGVLVLSGSSGRVETARADVLATTGATALTYQWFGGPDQPGICEFPLESFTPAVDLLAETCDRIVLFGNSKTAEAFLLYAADDPRVDGVIASRPSHTVWANVGPGPDGKDRPQRSSWTRAGTPLPFIACDDDFEVTTNPPAFLPMYEHSLAQSAAKTLEAASIPVERIFSEVLLIAGGDDQLWPSLASSRSIEARRAAYGLPTTVVTHPHAGHRVILPGESVAPGGIHLARGGTEEADRALGERAWQEIRRLLGA